MFGLSEKDREIKKLREEISSLNESRCNLQQHINTLQCQVDKMQITRTNVEVDRATIEAADEIVDFWFRSWGGRTNRDSGQVSLHTAIKSVVRRPILLMLRGNSNWPPDWGGKVDDRTS